LGVIEAIQKPLSLQGFRCDEDEQDRPVGETIHDQLNTPSLSKALDEIHGEDGLGADVLLRNTAFQR
jgi:hypothetical protein